MPYTPPGTLAASLPPSPSLDRNHHRSRSFTDEPGPGAFAPIVGLPRRQHTGSRPPTPKFTLPSPPPSAHISTMPRPASPAGSLKASKFDLHGNNSSEDSDDDDDNNTNNAANNDSGCPLEPEDASAEDDFAAPQSALAAKVVSAPNAPTPPPELQIPFPSLSSSMLLSPIVTAATPIVRSSSTPQIQSPSMENPPSIYRSPYSSLRSDREPATRNRTPLKPALKSNHSSPHLPSLAHQRALTQSAPSAPNLFKSSWSSPGSPAPSSPSSPGSTYSIPQTPKQVHFASEKSHLESVVVFTKGARPRSLSNPGGNDTETETEGYDSSGPSWARAARYPFPVMPKDQEVVLMDESRTTEVPTPLVVGSNGYLHNGDRQFVLLETLMLPGTRPPTLRGSVLVRNVAFQKRVAVRFTLDDWQTTSEVSCNFSASLPSLPPPFSSASHSSPMGGHNKSASMSSVPSATSGSGRSSPAPLSNGGKGDAWDRFVFTIKLEDVERTLPSKRIYLVVRYQVPSQWGWETGGEWWDNNSTQNYTVAFKMGKKITASNNTHAEEGISPSALAARMSASIQRPANPEHCAGGTHSLPPLPPPGPVRSSGQLSPSSSVLGLKINKPVLPPLSTNAPLKLRAGRGPTFAELTPPRNSPPGSPAARNSPTRTSYAPPLPGTVPGITFGIIQPEEKEQLPAPQQPLKISTADLPPVTTTTPAGTVGKKRGLSLSNYVSPVGLKSPSSIFSPTGGQGVMPNIAPLVNTNTGGGDGGEGAYTCSPPSYTYSPPVRKDSGPITPGSELRIVGGMPATVVDEPMMAASSSRQAPARAPSWDVPLTGFWTALGGGIPGKEVASEKKLSVSTEEDGSLSLPTPPESSGDSGLSTPDLERSPEQEQVTFGVGAVEAKDGLNRDSPTPTLTAANAVDVTANTSSVPFPLSSPVVSTFPQSQTRSPPEYYSSDEGATARPALFSPIILTPNDSDDDDVPPVPAPLSSLGLRASSQTGTTMKLEMPARPVFKAPSPNNSGSDKDSTKKRTSPPRMKPSSVASSSDSLSSMTGKKSNSPLKRMSPMNGSPSNSTATLGLGLNVTSPTNGPPPEFLAKYCFFVSSPATSPPTSSPLSSVVSPGGNGSNMAMMNAAFGTGIDTPRASSPGLASATAGWWGYPVGSAPERDGISIGGRGV